MRESILNALVQIFAIIANVGDNGISNKARKVVKNYLRHYLNKKQADEYLELFNNYLNFHHRDHQRLDKKKEKKRSSSHSVKILRICQKINEGLTQKEKMIVLVRLIEFTYEDDYVSEQEFEFLIVVAETFNISKFEFFDALYFINREFEGKASRNNFLIIDKHEDETESNGHWFAENRPDSPQDLKRIFNEHLLGCIVVLHIKSTNSFFFRYEGTGSVYLKGHNIIPERAYVMDSGSIIKGTRITPIYYTDIAGQFLQEQIKEKIVFSAQDVEFRFPKSNNGIQSLNFSEQSGQLIGIMGGSGVGKSTLLNVLNGKLPLASGKIWINGFDLHQDSEKLEGIIGFVPQDDLLMEDLTVFQNLYFNAKLCFSDFGKIQIVKVVTKVLKDLDLYDIRGLKVGNYLNKFISGGQRKRLNIALELMREPAILFVDEPTSGLSSMDSEMVMFLLKELTLKGKLVIINIHQPSSEIFKLFDKLWVMDKGGFLIYRGNPIDAIVYFKKMGRHVNADESECLVCGNVNPEQILQIVESKVIDEQGRYTHERRISPKEWKQLSEEHIEPNVRKPQKQERLPRSFFKVPDSEKQFRVFATRDILSKLANKQYLLINLLEAPLLALILAFFTKFLVNGEYIFSENKNLPIYLFMSVVVALFLGITVSAEEIIKDRKILERESFLNLSRASYINSKVLLMFGLSAFQMFTFVIIGNTILDINGLSLEYWFVLFSTAAFSNMLGLNISSGLNSVVTIYILIPFILVPQLLLGGAMVSFDDLHDSITNKVYVPVIGDIMTSRWAYEALAVTQFKANDYQKNFYEVEQKRSETSYLANYLINKLIAKNKACNQIANTGNLNSKFERNLRIITNEIKKLSKLDSLQQHEYLYEGSLTPELYDTEVFEYTDNYLVSLRKYYQEQYNLHTKNFESILSNLVKQTGGMDKVVKIKRANNNKKISEIVRNAMVLQKTFEAENQIVQKKDPIYMLPENNYGRAHFYAPSKKFFGTYYDTLWVNMLVIWIGVLVMYIALLLNLLYRILNYFDNIKLNRKSK